MKITALKNKLRREQEDFSWLLIWHIYTAFNHHRNYNLPPHSFSNKGKGVVFLKRYVCCTFNQLLESRLNYVSDNE